MEASMRALAALSTAAILLASFAAPLSAQQLKLPRADGICHHWGTELVSPATTCVSSHLPSRGAMSYGPDMLTTHEGAWCMSAPAVGQWVRDGYAEPMKIRRILITNGYAKSPESFRNNGRARRVAIETSDGVKMTVNLQDRREFQEFRLPRIAGARWVQVTILDVYPGARSSDVCLTEVNVDLEEFNR
jgi:hypothetical protein